MREIKFRAWNSKNHTLFNVFGFNGLFVFADTMNGAGTENNPACIEDCTLEQFTGLHDKNGKEIYEGDICLFPSKTERVIVFSDCCFGYFLKGGEFVALENASKNKWGVEVLGNIHENRELLNAH